MNHPAFTLQPQSIHIFAGTNFPSHMGGWWRRALVSLAGVAPSRMVSESASVNLPCTTKSRSSLLALTHPGGHGKRAVNRMCGVAHRVGGGVGLGALVKYWGNFLSEDDAGNFKVYIITSYYATMVHGLGCNLHRSTTTFAKPEMTSLMTS